MCAEYDQKPIILRIGFWYLKVFSEIYTHVFNKGGREERSPLDIR